MAALPYSMQMAAGLRIRLRQIDELLEEHTQQLREIKMMVATLVHAVLHGHDSDETDDDDSVPSDTHSAP